jgi:tetratricopeptide (TPR) repeat protein
VSTAALSIALVLQAASSGGPSECGDADVTLMLRAQELLVRGDESGARATLAAAERPCHLNRIASLALRGWAEARALAPLGGAVVAQDSVRRTLDELQTLASREWDLEAEYADTAIRAAIAAAQDERPEMELLLTHARDVSERLRARGRPALWPRSYNLLAGELWLEVDRYTEALDAYERAVRADPSPAAQVGLARVLARVDRLEAACRIYRTVGDAAPALVAAASVDLARCR